MSSFSKTGNSKYLQCPRSRNWKILTLSFHLQLMIKFANINLRDRMKSALSGWPEWSYEETCELNSDSLVPTSNILNYLPRNAAWNLDIFDERFAEQMKRHKKIKSLWGLEAVFIFLTGTMILLFIKDARWLFPLMLSALVSVYVLSKIRDLNGSERTTFSIVLSSG